MLTPLLSLLFVALWIYCVAVNRLPLPIVWLLLLRLRLPFVLLVSLVGDPPCFCRWVSQLWLRHCRNLECWCG